MNTHDKYELPPPHGYIYVWDGPYGTHRLTGGQYNGRQCDRTLAYYTEDQVHAAIEAARAELDEQKAWPSDEEIESLALAHGINKSEEHWGVRYYTELGSNLFSFARALLSKYAAPAPKGEPVALRHNWNEHLREHNALSYQHDFFLFEVVEAYVIRHLRDSNTAAPVNEQDAKDAQRLKWLCDQQDVKWQTYGGEWIGASGSTLRVALDAAIAQQRKGE